MSYGAIEESRKLGAPAELFLFRYGTDPGAVYAYTDVEEMVTHGAVDYNPVKIKRGGISASGSLDKSRMTVTVPIDSEIAELFRIYPPGTVVTLTIRGGHLSDPDAEYPVIWVGRVLSSARGKSENTEVELTCEPANTSLRRTGLRRNYQYSCPHVIYSAGDGLANADIVRATLSRVVLSKTNATVTLERMAGAFLPEIRGWDAGVERGCAHRASYDPWGKRRHPSSHRADSGIGDRGQRHRCSRVQSPS